MDTRRVRRGAVVHGPPVQPLSFQTIAPVSTVAPQVSATAAVSAQMPGSFAPHIGSIAPPVPQQSTEDPLDPSVAVQVPQPRRSPNPFVTPGVTNVTTQPGVALPSSPFPRQLADNGHLVATSRVQLAQTPRITVPIAVGNSGAAYNSPKVSGPANFGLSVSQHELWDDHPWTSPPAPTATESIGETRSANERLLGPISEGDEFGELEYINDHVPSQETSLTAASVRTDRLERPLTAGISRVQTGEADYGSAVRTLTPIAHEVDNVINGESPERYYYTFPTCILQHEYQGTAQNYEVIKQRTRHALQLARQFIQQETYPDEEPRKFSQGLRIYFKDALQMLSALFQNLLRANNGSIYCFKIDQMIYMDLTNELMHLRKDNEEGFTALGSNAPWLPKWGNNGNISGYWSANDFEILAAVYRTEVEAFLHAIAFARSRITHFSVGSSASNHSQVVLPLPDNRHTTHTPLTSPNQRLLTDESQTLRHHEIRQEAIDTSRAASVPQNSSTVENGTNGVTFATPVRRAACRPSNLHSTAFGLSAQTTSSNRLQAMFGRTQGRIPAQTRGGDEGPPSDDSSDDSEGERRGNNPRNPGQSPRRGNRQRSNRQNGVQAVVSQPQFDTKLKIDLIPAWDGNVDTLARWIFKVNRISDRSTIIHQQLGLLVPTRLTGQAEVWYYSQSPEIRSTIEVDWSTLRQAIGEYYMNEGYVKNLKSRANRARYRQREHEKETPSQYFIRKLELLQLSYNYNDIELIHEIMSGVPEAWMSVLSPKTHDTIEDFRVTFKYYEDHLMRLDFQTRQWTNNNPYRSQQNELTRSRNPFKQEGTVTRTNAVRWSKATANPPYPKDDANVSPKATPEQKGGRACRHCGSMNHWDPECKYARKGEKRARVNAVRIEDEDVTAQEEYDSLYYQEISDDEEDF